MSTEIAVRDYAELNIQEEIREVLGRMNVCNCGNAAKYDLLHDLLERAAQGGSFYEPLEDRINAEAVEFIADVMTGWGLLEHGSGIGSSWITEDGALLLGFFRSFDTCQKAWPQWAHTPPDTEPWWKTRQT